MKRLMVAAVLFSGAISAHAQFVKGSAEVFAGVGYLAGREILTWHGPKNNTDDFYQKHGPVPSLGASYVLKKGFRIGLTVSQHSYSENFYNEVYYLKEYFYYDALSVAVEVKADYMNRKYLQIYGAYGLGAAHFKGSTRYSNGVVRYKSNTDVSLCFMPIGMRIGNRYAGYIEAGVGYKGVVTAGFSYKFR